MSRVDALGRWLWRFIQRENLDRLALFVVMMIFASAAAISWLEPGVSFINGLWWSVVTMTTVGYGDISPSTAAGRMIAVIIMFFGIGILGMLSATIATILITRRLKENRGLASSTLSHHIILCEWNHRTQSILRELRADPETAHTPVVLVADIENKPVDDDLLFFVRGQADDETLERANLRRAATVVVVGDDRLDPVARDAKVVLSTLTIEGINPDVYTIVELVSEANVRHCERAHANEIVVHSQLSSGLLSRAVLDHGVTRVISELLSTSTGNELYKLPVPASSVGASFGDAFVEWKRSRQATVLAVQQGTDGPMISNPPTDYVLSAGDYLIVIAKDRPQF